MKKILALGLMIGFFTAIGCDRPESPAAKAMNNTPAPAAPAAPTAQGGPTIGELAPEIVGVDLEGAEFKLSDYKGQVIMLDFYGDW